MSDPHEPYVDALVPLIETLVRVAPDVLAAEASRETPDVWENEQLEADELVDGILVRFPEDEANVTAVTDALGRAAEGTGLSTLALARAVDLASETLQLVGARLRREVVA